MKRRKKTIGRFDCAICLSPSEDSWCETCRRSYDRWSVVGYGTAIDAILWTARRTRRVLGKHVVAADRKAQRGDRLAAAIEAALAANFNAPSGLALSAAARRALDDWKAGT